MIQVRQRVGHKHSLFMLEHVLTQANMHRLMLNVSVAREGLDMYFKHRNEAERTVQCIQKNMPVKVKLSKKLVSQVTFPYCETIYTSSHTVITYLFIHHLMTHPLTTHPLTTHPHTQQTNDTPRSTGQAQ